MKPKKHKNPNRNTQYANLRDCADILNNLGIKWVLFGGTLLGAIREGDIIQNDWDVDILILELKKDKYFKVISALKEKGFTPWHEMSNPACFSRDGEYIDLYRATKSKEGIHSCIGFQFHDKFFKILKKEKLGNAEYPVPNYLKKFIELLYEKDWRIRNKVSLLTTLAHMRKKNAK